MNAISNTAKLRETVEATVRRQLAAAVVHSVDVRPDEDRDGDPVLRITIVIEAPGRALDGDKILGLVRHLRSDLAKIKDERFPLLSFISKAEAAKLKQGFEAA